jgi:hypothetical protein
MSGQRRKTNFRSHFAGAAASLCLLSGAITAQTAPTPSTTAQPAINTPDRYSNAEAADNYGEPSLQVGLSATQIISILQSRPEVMVEIKDLLAQTQHGENVGLADFMTDEMVYSQIVSDKDLRQNITMFLRARGYVNDEDLQRGMGRSQSVIDREAFGGPGRPAGESSRVASPASAQVGEAQLANPLAETYSVPRPQSGLRESENENAQLDREGNDSTSEPQVLRRPTPYNLASLRDLYTQIPESSGRLRRFGSDVDQYFATTGPPQLKR